MVGVEFSIEVKMKNLLVASLVSFGCVGAASAQYYNGPQPISPPRGCVTGREGLCPTNRLPRITPGFPVCWDSTCTSGRRNKPNIIPNYSVFQ